MTLIWMFLVDHVSRLCHRLQRKILQQHPQQVVTLNTSAIIMPQDAPDSDQHVPAMRTTVRQHKVRKRMEVLTRVFVLVIVYILMYLKPSDSRR